MLGKATGAPISPLWKVNLNTVPLQHQWKSLDSDYRFGICSRSLSWRSVAVKIRRTWQRSSNLHPKVSQTPACSSSFPIEGFSASYLAVKSEKNKNKEKIWNKLIFNFMVNIHFEQISGLNCKMLSRKLLWVICFS